MAFPLKTERKRELGQFLTPLPIAGFMASLFAEPRNSWRILDAGAGAGALSGSLVSHICETAQPGTAISVTAYEVDDQLIASLVETYDYSRRQCECRGLKFTAEIRRQDFIHEASEIAARGLFAPYTELFNAAILNPPYRKIRSNSQTRLHLRAAEIETSNLYAGFLALAIRLLAPEGELVAITPRSFCNGPYFRPFRQLFLDAMSIQRVHVFDSRSVAFGRDGVLQENVIVHAIKSNTKHSSVLISSSSGEHGAPIAESERAYTELVSPSDPDAFIHLVTDETHEDARRKMSELHKLLPELSLTVSTGRVVDFRASEHLKSQPSAETVPLIRPCHFSNGKIKWPSTKERRKCAITNSDNTASLLVPAETYVLVKRFSAKEERRRIVAAVFDPSTSCAAKVGFENHLNYFHSEGRGFDLQLAKGLCTFLNSSIVDSYFRHFSGHTQVNATDLRRLRYPTINQLQSVGTRCRDGMDQHAIDRLIAEEIFDG
jgi:adenine-specific DNA-methyltransferase